MARCMTEVAISIFLRYTFRLWGVVATAIPPKIQLKTVSAPRGQSSHKNSQKVAPQPISISKSLDSTCCPAWAISFCYLPADRRIDCALHLHGFDHQQSGRLCSRSDSVLPRHRVTNPGNGRADLACFCGIGFRALRRCCTSRLLSRTVDFPRLAVQLEEDGPVAIGMRFADGQEFDDERSCPASSSTVDLRRRSPSRKRTAARAALPHRHSYCALRANLMKTSGYIM